MEEQRRRGRYRPGEGVIGRVFETGLPAAIPRVSEEPLFLHRTGALDGIDKDGISFVCVPIKVENEVVGTLSADRVFRGEVPLEEDIRLLSIIAAMIAQAVRLRRDARKEQERLERENERLRAALADRYRPANLVGKDPRMEEVYELIAKVAPSDATVLLRGESGTGKELVARAVHAASRRAKASFVRVNCAALPEALIESELFGHEKGAFTGATRRRLGRFELAHGGTIFLDEVGDFPPATQVRLLRVLQEREFERLGGTETIHVDVRVIAATNRDLEAAIREGTFREDLYYRLNVFPIHLPPLRERRSDILLLANFFVEKYAVKNRKKILRISTPAIDMLMRYHWPGNVRELENVIERAVLLSTDGVIHGYHLPPTLQTAEATGTGLAETLPAAVERLEREMIQEALKAARGNSARAARALGLTERVMGLRIRKYGIDPKRFR